jgi:hypothetical protein
LIRISFREYQPSHEHNPQWLSGIQSTKTFEDPYQMLGLHLFTVAGAALDSPMLTSFPFNLGIKAPHQAGDNRGF